MQIAVSATQGELDGLLGEAKKQFPPLEAVTRVAVKNFGVQADLNTPVGNVRVDVELRIEGG